MSSILPRSQTVIYDATNVATEEKSGLPQSQLAPFDQVGEQLRQLETLIACECHAELNSLDEILETLQGLNHSLGHIKTAHHKAVAQSENLFNAQADAIVRSAEIIEELERTKNDLDEARQIAERQREEQANLLSRVFENSHEGVVILDAKGSIQEVNPVFARIAHSVESELVGRPLNRVLEWVFPDYPKVLKSALMGEAWNGRVVVAHGDREERSYLISLSPVQNDIQLANVIVLFSDVTDIEKTQRTLQHQALHDQLTGLPNRRFYRERIQSMIDNCSQNRSSFSVCFIDLDNFKQVNDSLGHLVGDELLKEVAKRIRRQAGEDAFVARFGGDEFAILIPNTNSDICKTATIADSILQSLRDPVNICDSSLRIAASIGVTEYPLHSQDVDELLQFADVAMYAAKKAGRNRILSFVPKMQEEVERRHRIQGELHRALDKNELFVAYQPLIELRTGRCVGSEALARWRTPDGRQIAPSEFIAVAEQSELVNPLGEAVFEMVCQQLVEWQALGCRPQRVSINVSPRQLYGKQFVRRVQQILNHTKAQPDWITLEITENAVMEDVPVATRIMDELTELGIWIALDDFGTGHSSLSYLSKFNVHSLKIDRSFITDLTHNSDIQAIVESVIHMSRGRQLKVVAEGIETEEQYELLKSLKCDLGQGYYIAHPLRCVDFEMYYTTRTQIQQQVVKH